MDFSALVYIVATVGFSILAVYAMLKKQSQKAYKKHIYINKYIFIITLLIMSFIYLYLFLVKIDAI